SLTPAASRRCWRQWSRPSLKPRAVGAPIRQRRPAILIQLVGPPCGEISLRLEAPLPFFPPDGNSKGHGPMAGIVLNVEKRERVGTGGARSTRKSGLIPGVLYGGPRG